MSKGSNRRPTFIDEEAEEAAWERTFGAPKPKRVLADPATCAHRHRVYTSDAAPYCWACGVTWTPCDTCGLPADLHPFYMGGKKHEFTTAPGDV
jgi:hypothetical protein